jgi:single-strand DNA-binding protein
MLTATAHGRLGRDVELRYTPEGKAVAELALACNYGRRGEDGNYPTQWVRASLWDKQAEALAEYLTKGKGLVLVLRDVNVRQFDGKNGPSYSLEGTVVSLEFAAGERAEGGGQAARAPAPAQAPRPQQRQEQRPPAPSTGFDDMDDDIPF